VGPVIALVSYAFAVQVAAALGATRDLAALYDLLAPYRGLHVSGRGGALYYSGPVDLYLGLAAAHLGRLDEAAADLEQAVDACADNGAAGFHAEALCELITVLTQRATPADLGRARALASECRKQLAALNMTPWLARLDQLQDDPPELLTRREREIAGLVAQGLTNRDIAAQLYLSERTAQNHVQHILTKLGVTNRSRIAVWVTNEQMTRPVE
jgi:DNA-binding CsgD family transcriptional regulator